MDLLDLLKATGGESSVGKLSDNIGLDSSATSKLIAALAPALMGGLTKNANDASGLDGLRNALRRGNHDRYIDDPDTMRSDATRIDGNKILGHILGNKDVSRQVAASAEKDTGIDASLIKKALPFIAALAMGAMNKKSEGGRTSGLGDLLNMARRFL